MLKNVQLRTPLKDDYEAAKEVADALKKSKKFDGTKIFLCRQVAGIAVPKGEKQDPYVHSFTFVSNDKDELQKLADNFNKILFPNHEKDELLGVNVRKNTDNYEDVFESKKIKAEESEKLEEASNEIVEVPKTLGELIELLKKYSPDKQLGIYITEYDGGDLSETESYNMRINDMTSDYIEISFAHGVKLFK